MSPGSLDALKQHIQRAPIVRLFLDYDGTLADFAPNPDVVLPDPAVQDLLAGLVRVPNIFPAVISGRRLAHMRSLLPVEGVLLAGTYGVEIWLPDDELRTRADYAAIRPILEELAARWQPLLKGRPGFYLEDKDWALAIHAGKAPAAEAEQVLHPHAGGVHTAREFLDFEVQARRGDLQRLDHTTHGFRLLGGHQFLELAPRAAHKGLAVGWVLDNQSPADAFPVYIGDDDKDEEAFEVIAARGGAEIKVGAESQPTRAQYHLPNPAAVRAWLKSLIFQS